MIVDKISNAEDQHDQPVEVTLPTPDEAPANEAPANKESRMPPHTYRSRSYSTLRTHAPVAIVYHQVQYKKVGGLA